MAVWPAVAYLTLFAAEGQKLLPGPVHYLLDLLEQHYSGKKKTHRKLYTVLSFLIWYQVYFPEKCGVEPFRPAN